MKNINSYKIYFISGVSGVGKTSIMDCLKKMLPLDEYDIHDIDERGVPDGGGLIWLNNETRHWLDVANLNAKNRKSTVVCGFANPDLFKKIYKDGEDLPAQIILLHASDDILRERLHNKHITPESIKDTERMAGVQLNKFIEDTVLYGSEFKAIFEKNDNVIVETDNKTSEEVAREVEGIIYRN